MKYFLIIATLFLPSSQLFSQTIREVVRVDGKVKSEDGKLTNVRVSLLKDGEEVEHQITKSNGKFVLNIPLQANYYLIFSKIGYRSKYVEILAGGMPEEDAAYGYEFGGLSVTLFKNIEGLNAELLDRPVAEIIYDLDQYKFVFNVKYFQEIEQQKIELEKELAEIKENKSELAQKEELALNTEKIERKTLERAQLKAVETLKKKSITPVESDSDIGLNTNLNNEALLKKLETELADSEKQKQAELKDLEKAKRESLIREEAIKKEKEQKAKEIALLEEKAKLESLEIAQKKEAEMLKAEQKKLEQEKVALQEKEAQIEKDKLAAIALAEKKKQDILAAKEKLKNKGVQNLPETPKEIKKDTKASKEIYRKGNKTITEITVGSGPHPIVLKKVVADWGGRYFFKGSVAITEVDFDLEVEKLRF